MIENTTPRPPAASGPENDAIGLRRKPDPVAGRPPIPPAEDPRIAIAKTWSETARAAARAAFEKAKARGASREEAIEAGHRAGLRRVEKEARLTPAGVEELELVAHAKSLFGARVVEVLPARRGEPRLEDRCFEMLFPDQGFPEPAEPATAPRRIERDDEDEEAAPKEKPREALAGELARKPRQAGLFDRETRSA